VWKGSLTLEGGKFPPSRVDEGLSNETSPIMCFGDALLDDIPF
jgi:hypothetical protein